MEIVTGYRVDDKLRKSLGDLAKRTFGIDLCGWYDNGFWQNDYIPYSVIEDGRIVSNISVNVCNIKRRSKVYHMAQLGTVMTDEKYRGRGYSRLLMERVVGECSRSFDGIYLFAQDDMSSFYEQFGFERKDEYQCRKKVNITNPQTAEKIQMDSKEEWNRMVNIIQRRMQYGEYVMVNNPGLFMFYLTGPMLDCVYYIPSAEAYVIASVEGEILTVYAVFSSEKISLGEVISSFGDKIKLVVLAFTPEEKTGFEQKKIESDDNVLFTMGEAFKVSANDRFMFPLIAQA